MYRGTTPTLRITIKNDIELLRMKDIWVTVKNQLTDVTYKKSLNQLTIEEEEVEPGVIKRMILVVMKQQDTLAFAAGKVKIQVRFLDDDDTAYSTKIVERDMKAILKEGIIHG